MNNSTLLLTVGLLMVACEPKEAVIQEEVAQEALITKGDIYEDKLSRERVKISDFGDCNQIHGVSKHVDDELNELLIPMNQLLITSPVEVSAEDSLAWVGKNCVIVETRSRKLLYGMEFDVTMKKVLERADFDQGYSYVD